MIRNVVDTDFAFIYNLYMHPNNNPYLLYEHMPAEVFLKIFNELMSLQIKFIYERDGKPIGMCKLIPLTHRTSHIVYLGGLAIHPELAGKGYGYDMLMEIIQHVKEKGFLRIELSTASTNGRAISLYEKAGFVKEGILRKYSYLESEDRFLDETIMSYIY
jgi:putative acetyltransferase